MAGRRVFKVKDALCVDGCVFISLIVVMIYFIGIYICQDIKLYTLTIYSFMLYNIPQHNAIYKFKKQDIHRNSVKEHLNVTNNISY